MSTVREQMGPWIDVLPQATIEQAEETMSKVDHLIKQGVSVCPPQDNVFRAFQLTPPESIRCVICGQDPYPTIGHAMGLSFSVEPSVRPLPRSLKNIFKELNDDLGLPIPDSGDLTKWAAQGVLLLNTVLTVEAGSANSHKNIGWKPFTTEVLKAVSDLPQPIVFIQWGKPAIEMTPAGAEARQDRFFVRSTHPSPLSASRPAKGLQPFLGSRPFSTTNSALIQMGQAPIDWALA